MDNQVEFSDFKLHKEDFCLWNAKEKRLVDKKNVYHYTTVIELLNNNSIELLENEEFISALGLPLKLQEEIKIAVYRDEYGETESLQEFLNTNKKDKVEERFITLISKIGLQPFDNLEGIVQYIFEYILSLPKDNWGDEDIMFGFQYWVESK